MNAHPTMGKVTMCCVFREQLSVVYFVVGAFEVSH